LTGTTAVDEGLWERVEALIPPKPRRFRNPGRKRLNDRRAMDGYCSFCIRALRGATYRGGSATARE
jgi:transposase